MASHPSNISDWKAQNAVLQDVAAFGAEPWTLTGDGEPEQLLGPGSASDFRRRRCCSNAGPLILPEEYEPGKGRVVIWDMPSGNAVTAVNSES